MFLLRFVYFIKTFRYIYEEIPHNHREKDNDTVFLAPPARIELTTNP